MPYQEVEQIIGLFLWRCDECGDEQPKSPVPKHRLGRAPHHDCPHEGRLDMKAILDDQAEKNALNVPLHLGDIVEEIATKRQEKIDSMNQTHGAQGQTTVTHWRIFFGDGMQPILAIINDRAALRLVKCPHSDKGEPRFVPARGIMG
jgi:hypothetical protein